jgi:hypothetical protein
VRASTFNSRIVCSRRAVIGAAVCITGATLAWPAAPAGADPVPVAVVVMENQSYEKIVGNPDAPFINWMISQGDAKTKYTAVMRGSGHNYLAMTSGVTDRKVAKTAPNIFAALGNDTSWRTYEESMPSTCFKSSASSANVPGSTQPLYTKGHNPGMLYNNVAQSNLCNNIVPMDNAHFDPSNLPQFSLIVPNQCNNMHTLPNSNGCPVWDGTTSHAKSQIAYGDQWLMKLVGLIGTQAKVVLTFDEGCCGTEHIVTVVVGPGVGPGTDNTGYNHYGLEAGLYAHFGLGTPPGQGKSATPMVIA